MVRTKSKLSKSKKMVRKSEPIEKRKHKENKRRKRSVEENKLGFGQNSLHCEYGRFGWGILSKEKKWRSVCVMQRMQSYANL